MIIANTPSAEEVLKRINDASDNSFNDQESLQNLLQSWAKSIGDREVAGNAVNLKWEFAVIDADIPVGVLKVIYAGWYEVWINAIYKEYPEFAAQTITLFHKIHG